MIWLFFLTVMLGTMIFKLGAYSVLVTVLYAVLKGILFVVSGVFLFFLGKGVLSKIKIDNPSSKIT